METSVFLYKPLIVKCVLGIAFRTPDIDIEYWSGVVGAKGDSKGQPVTEQTFGYIQPS